jgi:uncharacterized Zn-finger protein
MDQQEQLKIWFCGFYEGEGSISNDVGNRNRLRISISQNDRTPLDIGKKRWGGFIRERIRTSPSSNKICYGHDWVLNHRQSIKFIEDIKPYMMIPYKIQQIEKCIEKSKEIWDIKFKCSFCDCEFSDMSGRRRHEKQQHIDKGIKIKCDFCKKEYCSRDSMKRHIRLNHNSVVSRNKSDGDTPYNDGKVLRAQTTTEEVKTS